MKTADEYPKASHGVGLAQVQDRASLGKNSMAMIETSRNVNRVFMSKSSEIGLTFILKEEPQKNYLLRGILPGFFALNNKFRRVIFSTNATLLPSLRTLIRALNFLSSQSSLNFSHSGDRMRQSIGRSVGK